MPLPARGPVQTYLSSTARRPSVHAAVALSVPFVTCCIHFPASCFGSTNLNHAAISCANLAKDVLPTSSSDRVALRPSIAADFPLHRSASCSQYRWPCSAMTRAVVQLASGTLSFVAIESPTLPILKPSVGNSSIHCSGCHTSQDLSIPTWIQLRCSATMMDDTLTILSLEPMRMVTKLNRKSLRALERSGPGVVHCARPCVKCQHASITRDFFGLTR